MDIEDKDNFAGDNGKGNHHMKFESKQNFINTQIPLTWLITVFVISVLFMIGVATNINNNNHDLSNKLDSVQATISDLKKQAEGRDLSFQAIRELQYTMQRQLDSHEIRLGAIERRPSK